jgi:predicted dehydrogenase
MKEVIWGIIGVGDVTEVKSGPAFNKTDRSRIKKVMRRNLDKAKDYAERHHIPEYSNNADDLYNDPEINAIYIATPPSAHAEYTIYAAQAGKHVYVEKPMAANFGECQEMIAACENNQVKLFVAYYRRELEYFKKIKQVIDEGVLGEIKCVDIKLLLPPNKQDFDKTNLPWRVIPEIAGGGYFYDLASHQFDFLDYILGPIKDVYGHAANQANLYEAEDIVTASFQFESGIPGTGTWCFTIDEKLRTDKTEIIGSTGKIEFSYFSPDPIQLTGIKGDQEISIDYPVHVQQALITSVVDELLEKGKCVSTGYSAARTNWVLDKILGKI